MIYMLIINYNVITNIIENTGYFRIYIEILCQKCDELTRFHVWKEYKVNKEAKYLQLFQPFQKYFLVQCSNYTHEKYFL